MPGNSLVLPLLFLFVAVSYFPAVHGSIECYVDEYVLEDREPTSTQFCSGNVDSCEKKYYEDEGYAEYQCGYSNAHEGCHEDSDGAEVCYCFDDLCNGADGKSLAFSIVVAVTATLAFLAM